MKLTVKEIKELRNKYPFPCKTYPKKCSKLSKCEWCGKYYCKSHHKQKFCTTECYKHHRNEYKAQWKRENYQPQQQKLGTSNINGSRNQDFEKELKIIRNEKRRYRL